MDLLHMQEEFPHFNSCFSSYLRYSAFHSLKLFDLWEQYQSNLFHFSEHSPKDVEIFTETESEQREDSGSTDEEEEERQRVLREQVGAMEFVWQLTLFWVSVFEPFECFSRLKLRDRANWRPKGDPRLRNLGARRGMARYDCVLFSVTLYRFSQSRVVLTFSASFSQIPYRFHSFRELASPVPGAGQHRRQRRG